MLESLFNKVVAGLQPSPQIYMKTEVHYNFFVGSFPKNTYPRNNSHSFWQNILRKQNREESFTLLPCALWIPYSSNKYSENILKYSLELWRQPQCISELLKICGIFSLLVTIVSFTKALWKWSWRYWK